MGTDARLRQLLDWCKLSPEALFTSLALLFGTAMVFTTAPLQAPDENAHFLRACQIAGGTLVPVKRAQRTGGYLPVALARFVAIFAPLSDNPSGKIDRPWQTLTAIWHDTQVNPRQRDFISFSNATTHSPLPYIPQAIGIGVAQLFSNSALAWMYGGRLANLLATVALFTLAIRISPILKWTLALLALTPTSLFLMASLSPDALTNAVAFLYIAAVYRLAFAATSPVGTSVLAILLGLAAAVGLAKQMYYPLVLAYWLIPADRLGGRKRRWSIFLLLCLVTAAALGAWAVVVRATYTPVLPGIDPVAQLGHILRQPADFAATLAHTALDPTLMVRHVREYVGVLGWLDVPLPDYLVWVHVLLLLFVTAVDVVPGGPRMTGAERLLALGICLLTGLVVAVTIYLTWMPVGATWVWLQGRYFIPAGPLLALCCYNALRQYPALGAAARVGLPAALALYEIALLLTALIALAERYYF